MKAAQTLGKTATIVRLVILSVIFVGWLIGKDELVQKALVGLAILGIAELFFHVLQIFLGLDRTEKKYQKITIGIFVFLSLFVPFAIWAHHEATAEADRFAQQFIAKHPCRPTLAELKLSGEGWKGESRKAIKPIKRMGAYRAVVYDDTGRLTYGFLYGGRRTHVFPECKSANPEPTQS